jgi:hypothetical protein
MPITGEVNGQAVLLDNAQVGRLSRELVRLVRLKLWLAPAARFDMHYQNWHWHNRGHSVNLFLWIVEGLGGATLPSPSIANRLKRQKQQLERLLAPRTIPEFLLRFARWQREAALFARAMNAYLGRVRGATMATVPVLRIVRKASFITLQICAALYTGGASAAASGAVAGLARGAATNFLTREMNYHATQLGRLMSGENVTVDETVDGVINNAIDSVGDRLLGGIVGKFIGPLTSEISGAAQREIASGNLARGVALGALNSRLTNAVKQSVNVMIQRHPTDIRAMLSELRRASNERAAATRAREILMRNRSFRRILERNLEAESALN